jgi:serine protease Do
MRTHARIVRRAWRRAAFLAGLLTLCASQTSFAATLDPSVIGKVQTATFEVVSAKPTSETVTYEKPLPLDLLPFQERNDKYYSIGTAFSIGKNRYLTAAHVILVPMGGLWGKPALRDASGHIFAIDKIEKFSLHRDFVEFSVTNSPDVAPLEADTTPAMNSEVFAVGNALGTGVVVRDGLYTSNTPEEQDGRWNWLRFSAAASPGNSGGPLIDKDGKVIGIVLRKSPNENLNYALPIGEALNAPDHVADFDTRGQYRLDIFDTTITSTLKTSFALPLSFEAFSDAFEKADSDNKDQALKELLAKEPEKLFPNGNGSNRVLRGHPRMEAFPALIKRGNDGEWGLSGKSQTKTQLSNNGFIENGIVDGNMLFYLHHPDDIPVAKLHADPVLFLDTLLKSGIVKRSIASDHIRVTSLGKPTQDIIYTDRWQRRWQLRKWNIPFANSVLLTLSLPVPDGYVTFARYMPPRLAHDYEADLKTMLDFIDVGYHGKLSEWKDFLREGALLPTALSSIKIDADDSKQFRYQSKRVGFAVPNDVQAVAPDNLLVLGFSFIAENGKFTWDVGDIQLSRDANEPDRINIRRQVAPSNDMDDTFKHSWAKLIQREHPADGEVRTESDESRITAVVGDDKNATVVYTVLIALPSSKNATDLKGKLARVMSTVKVDDR